MLLGLYLSMIDNSEGKKNFEELYNKYKNLMLNRAYDIIKDSGLAEDAVHNAFIKKKKNMSKINDIHSKETKSYVMVITENNAKKIYNKQHKIIREEFVELVSPQNVVEKFEDKNDIKRIIEKIKSLPDIYRNVLVLKFYNDLTDKEISKALDISVSTVQKRIYRGRKILLSSIRDGENNGWNKRLW